MDSLINLAESKLLSPGGIATGDLDRVFGQLMGPSIDAADLYFQHSRSESWTLEEGIVKDGSHSIEQGVGVRAISGEKTGFAYSDEIVLPQLLEASKAARAIAQDGRGAGQHARLVSRHRSGGEPAQSRQDRPAARGGRLCALARPAHRPGDR